MTPDELLHAWHAQQTAFIEFRVERVTAILAVLGDLQPEERPLQVLDLGCGPGSLGAEIAEALPDALIVGVDKDPILLRLAAETNRYPDRVSFLDLDLTDPTWLDAVGGPFDAVVSATALHWLDPAKLAELYLALPKILHPGAVFLNADHLYYDQATEPTLRALSEDIRESFRISAIEEGAMSWEAWWQAARAMPGWGKEATLWQERWADKSPTVKVSLDFHLAALRAAGFVETTHIFRWFDDVVLYARLP